MVQNSPYSWAALDCFWSGTGYDLKGKMQQLKIHSELAKKREAEWLFGSQKMGKKIFHYHEDSASDPYSRSFGFVKTKDQLSTLEDALKSCKDPKRSADTTFIKGLKIREELMQGEGENR